MHTPAAITALSLTASLGLAQDALVMPTLVPEDAIAIAEIRDLSEARDAFGLTGPGQLWKTPEFSRFFNAISEDAMAEFDDALSDIGLERDDLEWPEGALGLGVFMADDEDSPIGVTPALLLVAELGEAEAFYTDLLERVVDMGLEERSIEVDDEEFNGVTIVTVMPQDVDDDGGFDRFADDAMMGDIDPGAGLEGLTSILQDAPEFHYAIADGTLVWSDNLDGVRSAIEGLAGELPGTLAGNDLLAESRAYVGEGATGFAMFNPAPLFELFDEALESGEMPEEALMTYGVMRELGLMNVRAVAGSLGVNQEQGDAVFTGGVLLSGFEGVWDLLPDGGGIWAPGRTVARDAISATRFQMRFDQIVPLARRVINSMPEEMRDMAGPQFQQFEMMGGPILASMRGDVESSQYLDRPMSAESSRLLFTAGLDDEGPMMQTLGMFAPMVGLTPREFEGGQIFSSEQGFVPIAVGIGSGSVLVGDLSSIEAGLRGGDAGGLAGDERFGEAARNFRAGAFFDSWNRTDEAIRMSVWQVKNVNAQVRQQLLDQGFTQEEVDEMFAGDETPEWIEMLPDAELIAEHFGDSYMQAFRTPEGIRFQSVMMRPR